MTKPKKPEKPKVEVQEEPGLAERLEAGSRSDADLAPLQDFAESVSVGGGQLSKQVARFLSPSLGVDATEGVGDDFWDEIYEWLSPKLETVLATEEVNLPVAVYWLDVPKVTGAMTKVSVSKSSEHTTAAEVKIAGIGGGPSATLTLKEVTEYETPTPEMLMVSAPATIQHVEVTKAGKVVANFLRVTRIGWDDFAWEPHPLDRRPTAMGKPIVRRFGEGEGNFSPSLDVERGTTWEVSRGLKLDKIGLDLTFKSKGSYKAGTKFSYTLPTGHRYMAERSSSVPCWFWTVVPPARHSGAS